MSGVCASYFPADIIRNTFSSAIPINLAICPWYVCRNVFKSSLRMSACL